MYGIHLLYIFVPKKNLLQDLISRGKAMSFFAILIKFGYLFILQVVNCPNCLNQGTVY